jgi:hypothetical protein
VIKVAVTMPAAIGDAGEFLANVRALETAGADMIRLEGDGEEHLILLGAVAAVTSRVRLRVKESSAAAVLQRITHGRALLAEPAGESWVTLEIPPDRESWTAALREQEASGVTGVIVEWDPRLIDLLRNNEPDDRSDLLMSVG